MMKCVKMDMKNVKTTVRMSRKMGKDVYFIETINLEMYENQERRTCIWKC